MMAILLLTSDTKGMGEVWEPYQTVDVVQAARENEALWRMWGMRCAAVLVPAYPLARLRREMTGYSLLPFKVAFDWFANEVPRVHIQLRHLYRESHDGLWPADDQALRVAWEEWVRQFVDHRYDRAVKWPEPSQGWEGWRRARRIL